MYTSIFAPNDHMCWRKLYKSKQFCLCTKTNRYILAYGRLPEESNLHLFFSLTSFSVLHFYFTKTTSVAMGTQTYYFFFSGHPITSWTKNDWISRDSHRPKKHTLRCVWQRITGPSIPNLWKSQTGIKKKMFLFIQHHHSFQKRSKLQPLICDNFSNHYYFVSMYVNPSKSLTITYLFICLYQSIHITSCIANIY